MLMALGVVMVLRRACGIVRRATRRRDDGDVACVFGAAGAIGRALTARLVRAPRVRGVIAVTRRTPLPRDVASLPRLKEERGVDVRDIESMRRVFERNQIDVVWMLVAPLSVQSASDPRGARDVVVGGMRNLLALMDEYNVSRVLFSDSIGSYGSESPKGVPVSARWLVEHPRQDPESAYGRQKKAVRVMMREWELAGDGRDARWAVIPGVLHGDAEWGGGTTEYALDAIKSAFRGDMFACPVPLDAKLPMIWRSDLIDGLVRLTCATEVHEPWGGYAISGLSFTARELFASIQRTVAQDFTWRAASTKSAAYRFATIWPDALESHAAKRDFGYAPTRVELDEIVVDIFNRWSVR